MRVAFAFLLPIVLITAVLGACAASVSSARRSGLLIEANDAYALGFVINWAKDLKVPKSRGITSIKVLDDLVIVIEQPGNLVTAVAVRDGEIRWEKVVGTDNERLYGSVRIGDRVFINSESRMFTLNAQTGQTSMIAMLDHVVAAAPGMLNDLAIFGGMNGVVFAHDVNSGRTSWRYRLAARIHTPPLTMGPNTFVADGTGKYAMLNGANGRLLWSGHLFGPVTVPPTVDRVGLYVACEDRTLYALNRINGKDKWKHRTTVPLRRAPSSTGLTILLPVPGQGLVAIDAVDGAERWWIDGPAHPIATSDGQLLVLTSGQLCVVDVETGRLMGQSPTRPLKTALSGPDQSVILVSTRGRLLRLNPS